MKSPDFIKLAIEHQLPLRLTSDGDYAMSFRKIIMQKIPLFAVRVTKSGLVLCKDNSGEEYLVRMSNLREYDK